MSVPRVAVIPVGRIDSAEVEGATVRAAKVLHAAIELRAAATLPKGVEDSARGQFKAKETLATLRAEIPRLAVAKTVGEAPAPAAASQLCAVFVTDVDLFTPDTDAVLSEIAPLQRAAIVSVRRMREAFWKRKADPVKQRARLVKELLRAAARLAGLPDCNNADCALSPTRNVSDLDGKTEHYCGACWKRMSAGTMRI